MKLLSALFAVCMVQCVGCTHTMTLCLSQQDPEFSRATVHLKRITNKENADINFVNGKSTAGSNIEVGKDSCRWLEQESMLLKCVANAEIRRISRVDRLRGAGEGALLGIGAGVGLGYAMYASTRGSGGHPDLSVLAIPVFGVLGGLTGIITGVAAGSHDEFEFQR